MECQFIGPPEVLAVLDIDAVRARLSCAGVMTALGEAFADLAAGDAVQPAQTVIPYPGGKGDCIVYSAMIKGADVVGVKLSPYMSELAARGDDPVTAYTVLLSASTGRPLLLCDSLALTATRTAATTALAVRALCDVASGPLCVIGAGALAIEHLRFAASLGPWPELRIYSPSLVDPQRPTHQARLRALGQLDFDVQVIDSAAAAVADCVAVLLCTNSAVPVIDAGWIAPDVLVTSIATNAPGAHEISPEALPDMAIYCDYRATAPTTAGEFVLGIELGLLSESDIIADLPELLTAAQPPDVRGRRYFRSTGLGIEDVAIARLLV
jgi:L-arginine dehydrogenase